MRKTLLYFCFLGSVAIAQPTITGVNAFWYLGPGILSDRAYYAQAAWTANANGAVGTSTWNVMQTEYGGSVSLSCYTCTNTVATAEAPSSGCNYDVTVYLTYPDGSQSPNFYVAIVTPKTTTLAAGYPQDEVWNSGYQSVTGWNLTDSCGYSDSGLDGNESFGNWSNDTNNNWPLPNPNSAYNPGSVWTDTLGYFGLALTRRPKFLKTRSQMSGSYTTIRGTYGSVARIAARACRFG